MIHDCSDFGTLSHVKTNNCVPNLNDLGTWSCTKIKYLAQNCVPISFRFGTRSCIKILTVFVQDYVSRYWHTIHMIVYLKDKIYERWRRLFTKWGFEEVKKKKYIWEMTKNDEILDEEINKSRTRTCENMKKNK